jgi:hypothetical protein
LIKKIQVGVASLVESSISGGKSTVKLVEAKKKIIEENIDMWELLPCVYYFLSKIMPFCECLKSS